MRHTELEFGNIRLTGWRALAAVWIGFALMMGLAMLAGAMLVKIACS